MRNPYEVLGIREGASSAEVRAAYKSLVKKYHPDQYRNNPLSDLADEKMKEINAAYDQISKQQRSGQQGGNYQRNNQQTYHQSQSQSNQQQGQYNQIRVYLQRRQFVMAEQLLNAIPVAERHAEWHYLAGIMMVQRGWYAQGREHLMRAIQLDPSNPEYQAAMNQMNVQNRQYRNVGRGMGYGGSSACDVCTSLFCADCLCECLGGDLIRCL